MCFLSHNRKKALATLVATLYVINVNANVNVNAFTFVYENRKRVYVKRTYFSTFLGREAPLLYICLGASRLYWALRAHFITFLGASRHYWARSAHFIPF